MIKFPKHYIPDYHFQVDLVQGNQVLAMYHVKHELPRFLLLLKSSVIERQMVTLQCILTHSRDL